MSKTTWIIFTFVVAGLFGGLIYISSKDAVDVSNVDQAKVQAATEESGNIADHTFGSDKNKVVLVEYGDFQCPGCKSAHPAMKTVKEKYKDQLTFVFRNYPLTSIHPNAKVAAAAAEAAGEMGKYWEMHDALYEQQDDWKSASVNDRTELFAGYAEAIGLDKNTFLKKLADNQTAYSKKITYDLALGKSAGVTGTPTFYLNGKKVAQNVKDGKLVSEGEPNSTSVWANPDAFGTLIVEPALKEAGIALPKNK